MDRIVLLLGLLFFGVILAGLVVRGSSPLVDPLATLKPSFQGQSGEGEAFLPQERWEETLTRVVQEVLGPCPEEEPRAVLWDQRARLVRAVFQDVRLQPQQGLQNGDRITVYLLYDASAAKDAGFRILDAQRQWVVRGLDPLP